MENLGIQGLAEICFVFISAWKGPASTTALIKEWITSCKSCFCLSEAQYHLPLCQLGGFNVKFTYMQREECCMNMKILCRSRNGVTGLVATNLKNLLICFPLSSLTNILVFIFCPILTPAQDIWFILYRAPYPDCFCWHTVLAVRADSVCYASKIWLSHAPHTHRRTFISFSIWCCSQHSPGCPCIFISHCLSCLPLSSISLTQN